MDMNYRVQSIEDDIKSESIACEGKEHLFRSPPLVELEKDTQNHTEISQEKDLQSSLSPETCSHLSNKFTVTNDKSDVGCIKSCGLASPTALNSVLKTHTDWSRTSRCRLMLEVTQTN